MNPKKEKGLLKFTLEYKLIIEKLVVSIIEGLNIVGRDFWDTVDSYVTVSIQPECEQEFKTKVVRKSLNPLYGENFEFHISHESLKDRTLVLTIWELDKYSRHHVIGHVREKLDHLIKMNLVYDVEREIKEHRSVSDNT